MKEFEKIIEEILSRNTDDLTYLKTKKYSEFLNFIWETIRKNNLEQISPIKERLGADLYTKMEKFVKKKNEEYYSLDYFRSDKIEIKQRKEMINNIYYNAIVYNDYYHLLELVKKQIDSDILDEIMYLLRAMTEFCVQYNRKGSQLVDILQESYDLDAYVVSDLAEMFNNNRVSIKLDYLIKRVNNSLKPSKK